MTPRTLLARAAVLFAAMSTLMTLGVVRASAAPTLGLDPTSGPSGTYVLVSGTGFGPSEEVDVLFIENGRTQFLNAATSDPSGAFSVTVTVPPWATVGTATIRAQGKVSHILDTATFTVTDASSLVKLNPTSGPPSSSVLVSGIGYGAGEEIDVTFTKSGQTTFLGSTTSTSAGRFALRVTLPSAITSGEAVIEGDGETTGRKASATFTVISNQPILTLTPDTGPVGTSVLATGTSFGASEEVDILFIQDRTQFIGSTTTDATGAFSFTVTIPSNAHPGTANIRAQGAVSRLKASTVFTVT